MICGAPAWFTWFATTHVSRRRSQWPQTVLDRGKHAVAERLLRAQGSLLRPTGGRSRSVACGFDPEYLCGAGRIIGLASVGRRSP